MTHPRSCFLSRRLRVHEYFVRYTHDLVSFNVFDLRQCPQLFNDIIMEVARVAKLVDVSQSGILTDERTFSMFGLQKVDMIGYKSIGQAIPELDDIRVIDSSMQMVLFYKRSWNKRRALSRRIVIVGRERRGIGRSG